MNRIISRSFSTALFLLLSSLGACFIPGTNVLPVRTQTSYAFEVIKGACGEGLGALSYSEPAMGTSVIIEVKVRLYGYEKSRLDNPEECITTFKKWGDALAALLRDDFLAYPEYANLAAKCTQKETKDKIFVQCFFYDANKYPVKNGEFVRDGNLD